MKVRVGDIPDYVYRNLRNFGNCALPYSLNIYSESDLIKHFQEKLKRKLVYVRKAIFYKNATLEKQGKGKEYYVVELSKRKR